MEDDEVEDDDGEDDDDAGKEFKFYYEALSQHIKLEDAG